MNAESVISRLATKTFGRRIEVHGSLGSTNDEAKRLAAAGAPEGTVVVALEQRAGRGRQDRTWIAEPGKNLTFSIVLRPGLPADRLGVIPLFASAAVASRVSAVCGKPAGCKWPNDVLVSGRKISGILCESTITGTRAASVVVGIGLNVNQVEFPAAIAGDATSIALETGSESDLPGTLASLLGDLESAWRPEDPGWPGAVVGEWTRRNVVLGKLVEVVRGATTIAGVAREVTEAGTLRIETGGGAVEVAAGDVHLR